MGKKQTKPNHMFQPPAMLQSFEAKELSAELCLDLSDVSVGHCLQTQDTELAWRQSRAVWKTCMLFYE